MATELKPLLNREFRRTLVERVRDEVKADPDLRRRYWRTLKRKLWVAMFASPFMLLSLWSAWNAADYMIRAKGLLHPLTLFSADAAGLFLSLAMLVASWQLLCGPTIMGTFPRLPMSDEEIYLRAWRRFSRLMFWTSLGIWLGIYGYLAWYTRRVGDAGVWIFVCAFAQAFLCLGLTSALATLVYPLGGKWAHCHWLWLAGVGWVVQLTLGSDGLPDARRDALLTELHVMLPTHWSSDAFAAFVEGGLGDLQPVILLGLGGLLLYGLAAELHRRWHPLRDVAGYTRSESCRPRVTEEAGKATGLEGWSLAEEHRAFWRGGGFIERIIHAVLKPRERLVIESLSTVPMSYTRVWWMTLVVGVAAGSLAWLMRRAGWTPWHFAMYAPCALAGFFSLFATTFRPFVMAEERRRTDQNPFPLLPLGGEEVFFATLKVELVKWVMVLPHAVAAGFFAWEVVGMRGVFTMVTLVKTVAMIWMVVGAMLSSTSMIPIMRQSDVYNFYLFRGWLAAFTQVLLICGPVVTVVALGFRWPILFWLAIPAALGSTVISCRFSLWQWRMGTYDFIGNPVVSGGMGGLMPNRLQNNAAID